jgi:hypothetical protein
MTLFELNDCIKAILKKAVVDHNLPVKFRVGNKRHNIDYSHNSNDYKTILFAEDWY